MYLVYYILFAPTWKPEENPKKLNKAKKPNVSETKWASNCADIVAENIVLIGFIRFFGFPRPGNCRWNQYKPATATLTIVLNVLADEYFECENKAD